MSAIRIIVALAIKLADLSLMLLGPLVFLFAYRSRKDNHFPRWAWLWGNDDHGIDGESFWAKKIWPWVPYWLRCFWWTCVRNPTFNFSKYVLGVKARKCEHEGDVGIGDKKKGGSYWNFAGPFFEYYLIAPYGKRCLRIRIGWKLEGKEAGEMCQFCFVVWPFQPYQGI